jgi:hypothetical protein
MVSCPKCGTKNDDDGASFCTNCGTALHSDMGSTIERHAKRFAKDMEQMGKKAGEKMAQNAKQIRDHSQWRAKHFEQRMDHISHRAENWYDHTFGIFGPLLASFVFLIVFRLALAVMEIPSVETPDMNKIAAVLLVYVLPLFFVTLLHNYTKYFARKSHQFKVFSPLFYSISLVLILWILSKILSDISHRFIIADLGTTATSLENSLPTIFVFVLLLGYVILVMNMPRDEARKP